MPAARPRASTRRPQDLTVALSQLLFPILVMLGALRRRRRRPQQLQPLRRLRDRAAVLEPRDHRRPRRASRRCSAGDDRIYAYAIGVLVGTALQLAMVSWDLRNTPFRMLRVFDWRSDLVKKVLLLMLPVTISLGLINVNLVINSLVGALVPGTLAGTGRRWPTTRRPRSTRPSGSTCCPRGCSRSRSRR